MAERILDEHLIKKLKLQARYCNGCQVCMYGPQSEDMDLFKPPYPEWCPQTDCRAIRNLIKEVIGNA